MHAPGMGRILHGIKEISSFIAVLLILVVLLTNFVVMVYSIRYIQNFIGGAYFNIPIFILIPVPLLILFLVGVAAYIWYILLAIIITVAISLFLYRGFLEYPKKLIKNPLSYKTSSIQEFAEIFASVMFLSIAITLLMQAGGVKTPTIGINKIPLYAQMLALLHASVYEEIVTRLVFLGIPVFIWRRIISNRNSEKPAGYIHILGGGYNFGIPEITFMLVSSAIFGIAHTPAWGWWKFLPAFIAGLGMSYLYLKYGIHYSILFHFATDFMSVSMNMNNTLLLAFGTIFTTLIALGVVFTISYAIKILQFSGLLHRKKIANNRNPAPPPAWIDVHCPNCGAQSFIYMADGKLKCTQCGTIFDPSYQGQSSQPPQKVNPPQSPP